MSIRECKVSFIDTRGIRHSTTVHATSVLEAAAAGMKQIRETEMIEDDGVLGIDGGSHHHHVAPGSTGQAPSVA
jgi:hypothetical protein